MKNFLYLFVLQILGIAYEESVKTIVALGIASFATIAQAKSDINIWNWSDYIGENTVADFEKASGLKANYAVLTVMS